ncbi:ATP-binding protein [Neptuniibacter sp. PT8_73]|uniref:ATP-binding protein n=1 Tax=Neptuniibacter sp. PT8_73 TaxID=3398206 RepID=UPI0039F4BCA4
MFFNEYFGKYRAIVISVAMFIFLDLGVLGLNFYISSQIADDAVNVNLAGRQRMLSQKAAKALLSYESALAQGQTGQRSYDEMQGAVELFDQTLLAFSTGGFTKDATGREIFLEAVTTDKAVSAVNGSLRIWEPIRKSYISLGSENSVNNTVLAPLVRLSSQNNLKLLTLMNDLTVELETVAKQKSDTLRWVQASAITLAIANFFLILFHFIGQLRQSDAQTEEARKETTEILDTVHEGLLLLDSDLNISNQYSQSVKTIFGEDDIAGMSFSNLLHKIVVGDDMTTTEEYIKLLLNEKVKENLIVSLNPLADVEISVSDDTGQYSIKHLSFRFNRTIEDGHISHILVTVSDITETVVLRQSLEQLRDNQGMQISALHKLVHLDNDTMTLFLDSAEKELHAINDLMKNAGDNSNLGAVLDDSFRKVHRVKGDAGALELVQLSSAAHKFEERLETLREKNHLKGSDFLPLTLMLDDMLKLISELHEIGDLLQSLRVQQQGSHIASENQPTALPLDETQIKRLAQRIAREYNKEIDISFDLEAINTLSQEQRMLVQTSVVQLVRNAVVHGIESTEERSIADKARVGKIQVSALQEEQGLRISVKDDGHGLDVDKISKRALNKGLHTAEELESFSRTRLMGLIFKPGFSTVEVQSEHAGRGVGMDLVRVNVNRLGGKVRIGNQLKRYCEISFLIPSSQLTTDQLTTEVV